MATVKYHVSHSFKFKGKEHTMLSQQYKVGVYVIYDNNPGQQGNVKPSALSNLQNKLRRDEKSGKITDLVFGPQITVCDDSGLWETKGGKT